jgi:pimeloyl-ACP methyl ester carboxylesterase
MITVVILPGMDGTGIELTDFVAALAPELEAIVVTYPNDRPMDYAGHEAVARTSLPIDRPFVLLGESYSGPIAISIAASAPRGLIGLVLCCSFARNPHPALSWLRRLVPFGSAPSRRPASTRTASFSAIPRPRPGSCAFSGCLVETKIPKHGTRTNNFMTIS